jgi:hypothetical protein
MDLRMDRISRVPASPGPTMAARARIGPLSARESVRTHPSWHPAGEAPETLPLFREPPDEPAPHPSGSGRSEALSLALHIYWSAMVELQSLGGAARRAQLPDERRALLALQQTELQRKRLAQDLLATIWRVQIGERPSRIA